MHPIVNEYINSDERLQLIVQNNYDKNDYLENIFNQSISNLDKKDLFPQLFIEIDQAIKKGHADTSLYMLFLSWAISFTSNREQYERANVLLSIGNSITRDNLHPVLQAFFLTVVANLNFHEGKMEGFNNLYREAISLISRNSPRYISILGNLTNLISFQGRLKELAKEDLDILSSPTNNSIRKFGFTEIKLTNATFIGNLEEGFALYKDYKKNFILKSTDLIQTNYYLLKILSGDFQDKNYEGEFFKIYVNICNSLLLGKLIEASKYYQQLKKCNRDNLPYIAFERYLPLHIELNLKNKGKSRLLLSELGQQFGGSDYLEDFFLARLLLLENNLVGANIAFDRLIKSVNRYGAINRLLFELQFAKEMKTSDILILMNGIRDKDGAIISEVTIEKPVVANKLVKGIKLIFGDSASIVQVKKLIKKFASLKEPVLITGETGTGKELVARALHDEGSYAKEPFLAINCGALAESLLQSELFGYVAGAFTGAQKERKGIFEAAGKGTVFLDEFGDISSQMQVSLLRILESNEIRLIGGTSTRLIECKIVIASNVDLYQAVQDKKFREDLYFRLARFDIKLPPLRERASDIPKLIEHFLENKSNNSKEQKISVQLLKVLSDYRWPGNIRELKNEIERLKILHADKELLVLEDFDFAHLQGVVPNFTNIKDERVEENSIGLKPITHIKDVEADQISKIIQRGSKANQRHEFISNLFRKYKKLTRSQIMEIASVSPMTASNDLKALCEAGLIEQKTPTKSVRSHYYILVEREKYDERNTTESKE